MDIWNFILFATVFITMIASGALPVAALRQWQGYWKLVAAIPLLCLMGWVALILLAQSINSESHSLWILELFAWAMLTLIYMVVVFTAKRAFEKADQAAKSES